MTSPSPASAEPITVADPDDLGDALEAAGMSIGVPRPQVLALSARVVELEAEARLLREERDSFQRVGISWEARATALLEALQFYATLHPMDDGKTEDLEVIDYPDGSSRTKLIKFGTRARAAINAGASNDRK